MVVMLWPGASSADGTMFGNLFGYKDFQRCKATGIHVSQEGFEYRGVAIPTKYCANIALIALEAEVLHLPSWRPSPHQWKYIILFAYIFLLYFLAIAIYVRFLAIALLYFIAIVIFLLLLYVSYGKVFNILRHGFRKSM